MADGHRNPKMPSFSGGAAAEDLAEPAALRGIRRHTGKRNPGEIDPARHFPPCLGPCESAPRAEPSHRYPWRSFKAVCPRRCWRQPGPPIPAPNLARPGAWTGRRRNSGRRFVRSRGDGRAAHASKEHSQAEQARGRGARGRARRPGVLRPRPHRVRCAGPCQRAQGLCGPRAGAGRRAAR